MNSSFSRTTNPMWLNTHRAIRGARRVAVQWLLLVSLCIGLFTLRTAIAAETSVSGCAVPIGGALKSDNTAVWSKLVSLSGGRNSRWLVIPTASASPEKSAQSVIDTLAKQGASAEMLPLSTRISGVDVTTMVRDPKWIAQIDGAKGIYFTGGAQERITAALFEKDGSHTPLLAAIWRLYVRGGVVAGSSAGAAIMSNWMFREPPDNLTVLREGAVVGRDIDRGLGCVRKDVFVDQHFLKRGRIGRLLPVMLQQRIPLGVGVEENTAAVICGNSLEVVGARGVLIADMRNTIRAAIANKNTSNGNTFQPFMAENVQLTYLDRNDRYDLETGELTLSATKKAGTILNHTVANFKPYYTSNNAPRFYADILGDNTIVNAMSALTDSAISEVHGLAFTHKAEKSDGNNIGFLFRLYKRPDTKAYFSSASGGEDYTVQRIGLDVLPVKMATPLFTPLKPVTLLPDTSANVPPNAAVPANSEKQAKMPD